MSLINKMLKDLEKRQAKKRETNSSDFASGLSSVDEDEGFKKYLNKRTMVYFALFAVILLFLVFKRGGKPGEVQSLTQAQPTQNQATPAADNPFARLISGEAPKEENKEPTGDKLASSKKPTKEEEAAAADDSSQGSQKTVSAEITSDTGETQDPGAAEPKPEPLIELAKISVSPVSKTKQSVTFYFNGDFRYEFNTSQSGNQLNFVFENTQISTEVLPSLTANSYVGEIGMLKDQNVVKFILTLEPGVTVAGLEAEKEHFPQKLVLNLDGAGVGQVPLTRTPVAQQTEEISGMYKVARPPNPEEKMQLDYESALKDLKANRMHAAIGKLDTLLKQYPGNLEVRSDLIMLYFEQGDVARVEPLLSYGLKINSQYPPFVMMKARLLLLQKNREQALATLKSIKPSIKEYPDFYATMAALEQEEENYQVAAQIYLDLIRNEPNQGRWWFGYGLALEGIGKRNIALQAYQKAVDAGNLPLELQAFAQGRMDALGS